MKYSINKFLKENGIKYLGETWNNDVNEEFKKKYEAFTEMLDKKDKGDDSITEKDLTLFSNDLVTMFNELHDLEFELQVELGESTLIINDNKVDEENKTVETKDVKQKIVNTEENSQEEKNEDEIEKIKELTKVKKVSEEDIKTEILKKEFLNKTDMKALGIPSEKYMQEDGYAADFEFDNLKFNARKMWGARTHLEWIFIKQI